MLVEGEFFVVGDYDDAEVILVFFIDHSTERKRSFKSCSEKSWVFLYSMVIIMLEMLIGSYRRYAAPG